MINTHKILFLSGEDFKEKSIQVIHKTPEAYRDAGWLVNYIVYADISKKGDLFYETPMFIENIGLQRYILPGWQLYSRINNRLLSFIISRVRKYLCYFLLFYKGYSFLQKNDVDIVYGYETAGFIAARMLKLLKRTKKAKIVSRFQGVLYAKEWIRRKERIRYFTNFDYFYALKAPSDLCIMTNDGSQGEWVIKQLHSRKKNVCFLTNGVEKFCISESELTVFKLENPFYSTSKIKFVSISRLDEHKRIDRGICIIESLVKNIGFTNINYTIVGEGKYRINLERIVESKGLKDFITFVGAIKHSKIKYFLYMSDFFMSMYNSTNVGNPLLEAIRLNKLIVTLKNGDTENWIQHKINGLIYPVDDDKDLSQDDYLLISSDINELIIHHSKKKELIKGIKETEKKLWTWEERFKAEIEKVEGLL